MDQEQEEALEESIEIWSDRAETGEYDDRECPLCVVNEDLYEGLCIKCIIGTKGHLQCRGTPYYNWQYALCGRAKHAQAMLDLLISLRED